MSLEKLCQAMVYGYEDSDNVRSSSDIGRYSIGLKSASSTFCDNLIVYSKTKDSDLCGCSQRFDSDDWEFDEILPSGDEIPTSSGTLVIWNHAKLEKDDDANFAILHNPSLFAALISRVKIYLSKAFCYFMKRDTPLSIVVNQDRLRYWSPIEGCQGICSNYEETIPVHGSTISIKTYILPPLKKMNPAEQTYVCMGHAGKIQDTQGFYVYRQHRLIVFGGWLGIKGLDSNNKSAYARIVVNFDNTLDEFMSVNFAKDSIKIPESLLPRLEAIAKKARKDSLNTYDYKRDPRPYRRHKKNEEIPVWSVYRSEAAVKIEVNPNNPLIQGYVSNMVEKDKKALFSLLAKTFPIGELANFPLDNGNFSYDEIKNMVERRVVELKETLSPDEIVHTILKEEPFCKDEYRSWCKSCLIDLFDSDGGII